MTPHADSVFGDAGRVLQRVASELESVGSRSELLRPTAELLAHVGDAHVSGRCLCAESMRAVDPICVSASRLAWMVLDLTRGDV